MSKTPWTIGQASKSRGRWWGKDEAPKDNGAIPDGLGIGVHEHRTGDGQLLVYFRGNNYTRASNPAWVVLGKFVDPVQDNKYYYVSNRLHGSWAADIKVTYHEDLLMAVSWIVELKQKWDEANAQL